MTAPFTQDQYEFLVRNVARKRSSAAILSRFEERWPDSDRKCTADDIARIHRSSLGPGWVSIYDDEREKMMEASLSDADLQVALLSDVVTDTRDISPDVALKATELIAKIQGGFFKGKTLAVDAGGAAGDTKFTFTVDRANNPEKV